MLREPVPFENERFFAPFLYVGVVAIGEERPFGALIDRPRFVGESVAFPAYSKILAQHFPEVHRGFANAVIGAGLACGPAFGMLIGGTLIARFGWRPYHHRSDGNFDHSARVVWSARIVF